MVLFGGPAVKRFLLAALLAIVAAGWTWDDARAATRPVYVVNMSTIVHNTDIANALPAFQAAVSKDFAPVWGQDARLVMAVTPPAGGWAIYVEDEAAYPFALGYHDFDGRNVYAHVSVRATLGDGETWQGVFTHELFEMLADPYIDRLALGSKMWLVEVADPVEADRYNYPRKAADGSLVPISDFVTPAWYSKTKRGPFDFARHVRRREQLLPGGYASFWNGFRWQEVTG